MATKVLMIGVDGATFSLLDPLVEQGAMPFLHDLLKRSVRAELMSTRHPLTPQAWTSMITGRSPEAHGIYDFLRPAFLPDGSVFLKLNDYRDNHCETIWSIANRHKQRATSLNFYGMSPAPAVDGYIFGGFIPWRHLKQAVYPKSLYDEVRALPNFDYRNLGMDHTEEKKCVQGLHQGEQEPWIELQNVRDRHWSMLTCHLMTKDRTELTALVLDGADKMQHLFWRFIDPAFADKEAGDWSTHLRNLVVDFYRGLDENIKTMVEAAGPETDILITSDHGFGPTTEIFYLNEWLARHGYLHWTASAESDAVGQLVGDTLKDYLSAIDWKRTLAFSPTPSSNAVFIKRDNGAGSGVKDDDYLAFVLKMQGELLAFRAPGDDRPVVVQAELNKLRGRSFAGPCPDITIRLRDGGFVSTLKSNEVLSHRPSADGTHRPAGIFIGCGPSFRKGVRLDAINILDISPLILTLMGIPVPKDMEGRVPTETLIDNREVNVGAATTSPHTEGAERTEATEEEREALMNQLKVLGYME